MMQPNEEERLVKLVVDLPMVVVLLLKPFGIEWKTKR